MDKEDREVLIEMLKNICYLLIGICIITLVMVIFYPQFNPFNIIALFIAILSFIITSQAIKLSQEAKNLAKDTDDRINEMANSLFMTYISSFEDRRLNIKNNPDENQTYLWKAKVDLDKAKQMMNGKCHIKDENYTTLISRFEKLMEQVSKRNIKFKLVCESIKNILQSYEIVSEFIFIENNKKRKTSDDRIQEYIKNIIGLDKEIKIDQNLTSIISTYIDNRKIRWKPYKTYAKEIRQHIKKEFRE